MLRLFIDTTGVNQEVALMENQKALAKKKWRSNYNESEILLPTIISLLHRVKKTFHDLDQVCVARGPGSFSSTRIGVTVANTLGFALGIRVTGNLLAITSLSKHDKLDTKRRMVTPLYAKSPNITKGKGIWSQILK